MSTDKIEKIEEDKLWMMMFLAAGASAMLIYGIVKFGDFSKKKASNDSSIAESTERAAIALERIADALDQRNDDWERENLPKSMYCRGTK